MRSDIESTLSDSFLPSAGIYDSTPSQKSLSAKIEAKTCHLLLDPLAHERHLLVSPGQVLGFSPSGFSRVAHPGSLISGQSPPSPPHAHLVL